MNDGPVCPATPRKPFPEIETVHLSPAPPPADFRAAQTLAGREAEARLGMPMLLAWYDRDRDCESPRNASECHEASAIPGYVDYGFHHGATLRVIIEGGRFDFFYLDAAAHL